MTTTELINYTMDLQFEYNIKLILIFGTLIMGAVSFYYRRTLDREDAIKDLNYYFVYWFGWLALAFFPLSVLSLARSFPLSTMITFMVGIYALMFTYFVFMLIFWLGKRFMENYFNVKFESSHSRKRSQNEYRRVEE